MTIQVRREHMPAARSEIRIRALEPGETEELERFYADLSVESRYLRFMGGTRGISHRQSVSFCTPDHAHREGFVAVTEDEQTGADRIVGHLCLEPIDAATAEVAVAVADAYQHHGIGHRLLEAGIDWARAAGIDRLKATMFSGNTPIVRLLAGAGWTYTRRSAGCGITEVTIDLERPILEAA